MIRFRPAAARELADEIRYYDKHYEGRGQRFAEAVERTLLRISELPTLVPLLYEPDIRSAKVNRFPYRVVFIVVGGDIDVLAVAHAKRRPGYWRRRTK
ncbi:MAG: type II toxin-antitoxin system RelE/ParE family toxin [Labilithrix sp.]|nr:type II toxin-antitoxin system RelE/ParE family toxin [Labilithrix sp.]